MHELAVLSTLQATLSQVQRKAPHSRTHTAHGFCCRMSRQVIGINNEYTEGVSLSHTSWARLSSIHRANSGLEKVRLSVCRSVQEDEV